MSGRRILCAILMGVGGLWASFSRAATFDDVQLWVGQGANQAGLVINWNDGKSTAPIVWGYRWDGEATGQQMLEAVFTDDSRLYFVTWTSVWGKVTGGIGFDVDGDGLTAALHGSPITFADRTYEVANDVDLDQIHLLDTSDHYQGGWYTGFWNYLVKDDVQSAWEFSWVGAADRDLSDGSWDQYSFVLIPEPSSFAVLIVGAALGLLNRRRRQAVAGGVLTCVGLGLGGSASNVQAGYVYDPTDFAIEVVASSGFPATPGASDHYGDPQAVLGWPATRFKNIFGTGADQNAFHRVKLIEGPYASGLDNERLLATFNTGRSVTVKMGRTVYDDPANPFGIDLIVFGNSFFSGNAGGYVNDAVNLNTMTVTSVLSGKVQVSVSPDNENWFSYPADSAHSGDWYYPTNAYLWDADAAAWTDTLADPTRPVNPSIGTSGLSGSTAAQVLDLYDGSAGGNGFDLSVSGFDFINYVRFDGISGFSGGQIDAVAAVRAVPEPASVGLVVLAGVALLRRARGH